MRLFGLLLTALSAYGVYYNWQMLTTEHRYLMKLAILAPAGVVAGLFVILFPHLSGKPETKREKAFALTVGGVAVAVGFVNWYLMDPAFFGG